MKLIDLKCPNCAATMKYDEASGQCSCDSCGATFLVEKDDPVTQPSAGDQAQTISDAQLKAGEAVAAKMPTFIWVLGWIIMYPIPASILINRSKYLSYPAKVTLVILVWVSYLIMLVIGYLQDR